MQIDDLGQTFGHANIFNRNAAGSVNFEGWAHAHVWTDAKECIANIAVSQTGTLDHPIITEAGRQFLTGLLTQLSDAQLHDLFAVARFEQRSHHSADDWVEAFKQKRAAIADARCPR